MAFGTVNTKIGSSRKTQDGINSLDRDIKKIKLLKEFTHDNDDGDIHEIIKFKTKNEFYYRDTSGYLRTYDIHTNKYSDRKGIVPAGKTSFLGSYIIKGNNIYDLSMTLVATMPGTIFIDFEKKKLYCYSFNIESNTKAILTIWNIDINTLSAKQIFTESYSISKSSNGTKENVYLAYIFSKEEFIYFAITKGVPGTVNYKYTHYSLDLAINIAEKNSLYIGDPYKTYDTLGVLYNNSNIILYHGAYTNSSANNPEINYYILNCNKGRIDATKLAKFSYGHKDSTDSKFATHNNFLMIASDTSSLSYLYTYGNVIELRQVSNGNDFTGYKGKSTDYMIFSNGRKVSVFEY